MADSKRREKHNKGALCLLKKIKKSEFKKKSISGILRESAVTVSISANAHLSEVFLSMSVLLFHQLVS